jgi:hypothetical protein
MSIPVAGFAGLDHRHEDYSSVFETLKSISETLINDLTHESEI